MHGAGWARKDPPIGAGLITIETLLRQIRCTGIRQLRVQNCPRLHSERYATAGLVGTAHGVARECGGLVARVRYRRRQAPAARGTDVHVRRVCYANGRGGGLDVERIIGDAAACPVPLCRQQTERGYASCSSGARRVGVKPERVVSCGMHASRPQGVVG